MQQQSFSFSASICFYQCPLGCFESFWRDCSLHEMWTQLLYYIFLTVRGQPFVWYMVHPVYWSVRVDIHLIVRIYCKNHVLMRKCKSKQDIIKDYYRPQGPARGEHDWHVSVIKHQVTLYEYYYLYGKADCSENNMVSISKGFVDNLRRFLEVLSRVCA